MNKLLKVNWENYKKEKFLIGVLAICNGVYSFKYNPLFLDEENIPEGFDGIIGLGGRIRSLSDEEKHKAFAPQIAHHLFNFFSQRIPDKEDADIWKEEYGLSEYDEAELLLKSKSGIWDNFSFEEVDPETAKHFFDSEHVGNYMER